MPATEPESQPLDTTVVVETPEHIRFRHKLAGPTRRLMAYVIDLCVRGMLVFLLAILAAVGGGVGESFWTGASTGALLLIVFVVEWGYYVLLETLTHGRSIGKRVFGLRVLKRNGTPITFGDSVLRNLLRAADFLPSVYALGAVVMGRDRYFRRLGDLAADTVVVSEARGAVRAPLDVVPPITPEELAHVPSRVQLSADELEAVELFLRRIGSLAPTREYELAELVAPVLASRMGVRYRDPVRLLALLHHRATQRSERRAHA